MHTISETTSISEDTSATLLLCASLGKRSREMVKPLTGKEYCQLFNSLRTLRLPPRRLISAEVSLLESVIATLPPRERTTITTHRLSQLLERGGSLALALSRWTSAGIWVASYTDVTYPTRYIRKLGQSAPAIVYGIGPSELCDRGGLAVVGSRKPDPESETYTLDVGRWAASAGVQIVSGAARGVDETSMVTCAEAGGTAIGVVAESLLKMSTRREFRNAILNRHITLLSSFDPDAGFTVGNAMARNRWVYALADQALVVACSEDRGGTWAGALEALKNGVRVYVKTGNPARPGNDALVRYGALPAPDNLSEILEEITLVTDTVSHSPTNGSAYYLIAPLILQTLEKPMDLSSLSDSLGLLKKQTSIWLNQLIIEGKVKKTRTDYQAIKSKTQQIPLFNKKNEASSLIEMDIAQDSNR